MTTQEPIRIWRFADAPEEYRLSPFGGDEMFVAVVSGAYGTAYKCAQYQAERVSDEWFDGWQAWDHRAGFPFLAGHAFAAGAILWRELPGGNVLVVGAR